VLNLPINEVASRGSTYEVVEPPPPGRRVVHGRGGAGAGRETRVTKFKRLQKSHGGVG